MASPDVLDFDRLLAPISEDAPAGVELKEDSAASAVYFQVKDAREAARTAERQALLAAFGGDDEDEEQQRIPPPDWHAVIVKATDCLAEKSKDLWVGAWLIEGLVREHGFAGLRDGFRLIREICERYWDDIHPRPDEDGYATTVAQLTGLNGEDAEGTLGAPINAVPITSAGDDGPLTGADYQQAVDLAQVSDPNVRQRRIDGGALSMGQFEAAVHQTPPEFYHNLVEDVESSLEEFDKMTEVLDEKCGKGEDDYPLAPPSSNIRNVLKQCLERIKSKNIAGHLFEEAADAAEEGGDEESPEAAGAAPRATGKIANREEAFQVLGKIADFFEQTEPHSPVSFALRQVVRWGRMSLPELLTELITDESVRDEMFRRTGVPKVPDDESG